MTTLDPQFCCFGAFNMAVVRMSRFKVGGEDPLQLIWYYDEKGVIHSAKSLPEGTTQVPQETIRKMLVL